MANTITKTYIMQNSREAHLYVTLISDGNNETGTILFDSSVVAAANVPAYVDPLNCRILEFKCTADVASTARAHLLFDASTDVLAWPLPLAGQSVDFNFRHIGGLKNYAGSGKTGDILLTTTGLASGDTIAMTLAIQVS